MRDATLGEVQASGWLESPDPDDDEPTVYGDYIVTGHHFSRVVARMGNREMMVEVRLHQWAHQADEPPAHRAYVTVSDIAKPAYRLGAKWQLVFTGDNVKDDEPDYS